MRSPEGQHKMSYRMETLLYLNELTVGLAWQHRCLLRLSVTKKSKMSFCTWCFGLWKRQQNQAFFIPFQEFSGETKSYVLKFFVLTQLKDSTACLLLVMLKLGCKAYFSLLHCKAQGRNQLIFSGGQNDCNFLLHCFRGGQMAVGVTCFWGRQLAACPKPLVAGLIFS